MNRKALYIFSGLIIILFSIWKLSIPNAHNGEFSEIVKVALRDAGNQLLLTNQDSTSLIKPIKALEPYKYRLTFEKQLYIEPDSLVSIIERSLIKADLPNKYRVEVLQCSDKEVAYSFDMRESIDSDIIPCAGRDLPFSCYAIDVRFTEIEQAANRNPLYYGFLLSGLLLMVLTFIKKKNKEQPVIEMHDNHVTIGSFHFYPEQNKLVKKATEISLSKKECEILALFVERPNQIIKRDELTKAVWEDNGVFVGRSLDTYISKLRKKLQDDDSIKLTNIHGVGYRLEIG